MSDGQDVQSSLADMDRKLRELQRELAMVTAPPEEPETSPPPAPATAPPPLLPRPASAFPAGPIAPTAAPDGPAPAAAGVSRPIAPGVQGSDPAYGFASTPAGASDPPSFSGAQPNASRLADEVAARVTELGRQVDDLQRLRKELQRSTAALAQAYQRAFDATTPPAPPAPYVPPPPAAVAPPPPLATPPPPAPPLPAPAAAVGPSDGSAFEGDVVINAGPFLDIGTLGSFEQALAQLPQAEDVYVRGFEGNRALIDLRLGGPIHLVDEMRRALPFSFGVVEVGNKLVTINVDPPAGGASPRTPAT